MVTRITIGLIAAGALAALLMVGLSAPGLQAGEGGDGKAIFMAQKCNMCHAVGSLGIEAKVKAAAMKGPDMSEARESRDSEWLAKYLRKEVQLDGKDHKKDFKGTDEELQTLIAWLQGLKKAG